MKIMQKNVRTVLSMLLCAVMLTALMPFAWAESTSETAEASPSPSENINTGIIDSDTLNTMVLEYLGEKGISTKDISIGFCYTATGDTWYYNGDTWFYPASMYKVPLIMLLSEKVASGELTQDSMIYDKSVGEIEELILTYSNNDWAHIVRKELGGDEQWRKEAMKYSTLGEADYHSNYMEYCYFSNRFLTDTMKTLFYNAEKFPNVIECLLPAEPNHYLRLSMEGRFDIAQKYGAYQENNGNNYVGATGIIYTGNPIIVTVMTKNVDNAEKVISDIAVKLTDYGAKLDGQLVAYQNKLQKDAEEAERLEQQRIEQEEQAKINAQRQEEEKKVREEAIVQQQVKQEKRKTTLMSVIVVFAMVITVVAIIISIVKGKQRAAQARRYEAYRRRYEAEQRSYEADTPRRAPQRTRRDYDDDDYDDGYYPRH